MLGEKMFLNMLLLIVASTYWYITGYHIPAISGYVFMVLFLYSDKLYFISLIMGIITLLAIIYFTFYDYTFSQDKDAISQVGISVLYMFVIFFQSKSIFNGD